MNLAIVTGASSGIGLEIARGLLAADRRVILAVRDPERGVAAARAIGGGDVMRLDVADQESVRAFAKEVIALSSPIDILVNNAGIHTARADRSPQGFELTMATNHLGHFLLTNLLSGAFAPGARIVNVASEAHRGARRVELDPPSGLGAYAQSKLANVMFTYALARRLEARGVAALAVHPGSVRSGWARGEASGHFRFVTAIASPFLISTARGARTPLYAATSPDLEGRTGLYLVRRRPTASSTASRDVEAQERLWAESAKAVGLPDERPLGIAE